MRLRTSLPLIAAIAVVGWWWASGDWAGLAPESAVLLAETGAVPRSAAGPPEVAANASAEASLPMPDVSPPQPDPNAGDTCVTRHRVLLLPTTYSNRNQSGFQAAEAARAAVMRALGAFPNLELVEITVGQIAAADLNFPVLQAGGGFLALGDYDRDRTIVDHFGGEMSIRVHSSASENVPLTENGSIELMAVSRSRAPSGRSWTFKESVANGPGLATPDGADSVGRRWSRRIYAELFPACAQAIRERGVTDTRLPDIERLIALQELYGNSSTRYSLSNELLASVIELARYSLEPAVRLEIWRVLGQLANPIALVPMRDAVLYDADPDVRAAAADALYSFLPDESVAAALRAASLTDPSDNARLHARWSLMLFVERASYTESALRDPSLSEERRLAPLELFRARYDDALSADALAILDELSSQGKDPQTRATAIGELGRTMAPQYFDSLVDAARGDPDPSVRRSAIVSLQTHRRESIETEQDAYRREFVGALGDPDPAVRTAAAIGLSRDVDNPEAVQALRAAMAAETDRSARAIMEATLAAPEGALIRLNGFGVTSGN